MNLAYEVKTTLIIDGESQEVHARAHVNVERDLVDGSLGAEIDGEVSLFLADGWTAIERISLAAVDVERVRSQLRRTALESRS